VRVRQVRIDLNCLLLFVLGVGRSVLRQGLIAFFHVLLGSRRTPAGRQGRHQSEEQYKQRTASGAAAREAFPKRSDHEFLLLMLGVI